MCYGTTVNGCWSVAIPPPGLESGNLHSPYLCQHVLLFQNIIRGELTISVKMLPRGPPLLSSISLKINGPQLEFGTPGWFTIACRFARKTMFTNSLSLCPHKMTKRPLSSGLGQSPPAPGWASTMVTSCPSLSVHCLSSCSRDCSFPSLAPLGLVSGIVSSGLGLILAGSSTDCFRGQGFCSNWLLDIQVLT